MMFVILIQVLLLSCVSNASIVIRGQDVDNSSFISYLEESKSTALKNWLYLNKQKKINIDLLVNAGERLLNYDLGIDDFYSLVNKYKDDSTPTPEWRQALVDILIKWSDLESSRKSVVSEDICFYFYLDSEIKEAHPELNLQCQKLKRPVLIEKPIDFKEDLITIDGVIWNKPLYFLHRKFSQHKEIQIQIYSDRFSPVSLKQESYKLNNIQRTELIKGGCHNIQRNFESLADYNIPLYEMIIISKDKCIDPADSSNIQTQSKFWKENRNWFIVGGIILGAIIINQAKDKEISFEFSF